MEVTPLLGKNCYLESKINIIEPNKPNTIKTASKVFTYNNTLFCEEELRLNYDHYKYFLKMKIIEIPKFDVNNNSYNNIKNRVIYCLHPYHYNYSHYTFQCIGAYLLAKKYGLVNDETKIAINKELAFQKELCSLAGIPEEKIINLDPNQIYILDDVVYSSVHYDMVYDIPFIEMFEDLTKMIPARDSIKLFITRQGNRRRKIVNNNEVLETLKKHNFLVVGFDNLSVFTQIALIKNSSVICAEHGASGANLVYCSKEKFKFIELFSSTCISTIHAGILFAKNCGYSPSVHEAINPPYRTSYVKVDTDILDKSIQYVAHEFKLSDYESNNKDNLNKILSNF